METDFLIIGAGPTGLGAACRLNELGHDWLILEATQDFGGLAGSFVDDAGFTWDYGGHVQFSHYDTFDRYMDLALGKDGWITHERESWVWLKKRFIPYPFQNNLHRLDREDQWACVEGLYRAWTAQTESRLYNSPDARPDNFENWMLVTFGRGITDLFMRPYNVKVWAYPPATMDFKWIGERVAVPDLAQVLQSVCLREDAVSWGPNATFRFPRQGGTGSVWRSIGRMLPGERTRFGCQVAHIDSNKKFVVTTDGERFKYGHLLSTMSLNHLIHRADGVCAPSVADGLVYSATNIVGIGLGGSTPDHLQNKCWMYFPQDNSPYYRVTVFSNYSPFNVPCPGKQWSLMAETAESGYKPVDAASLVERTIQALVEDELIPDRSQILSTTYRRLAQGYPTPFKGRDNLVNPILRRFEERGIWSRGRFGAWKYEVANQDHSFAQGYEWAQRMISDGGPEFEPTLFTPTVVNNRRNP